MGPGNAGLVRARLVRAGRARHRVGAWKKWDPFPEHPALGKTLPVLPALLGLLPSFLS